MKGRPVDQLVYEQMFAKGPRPADPQNFHALLQRSLILEVRQEVHSYYGHLDTQEAKYPGLDYTNKIHRIRLSRWPWHRRLFRAFDALGLTPAEISGLTKWEGTKWAKERFEREQNITIRDTTADGMGDFVEPEDRPTHPLYMNRRNNTTASSSPVSSLDEDTAAALQGLEDDAAAMREASDGLQLVYDSEEELESVGESLNERLRLRVALRNASGDNTLPLDEEWETWLKNAMESGQLDQLSPQSRTLFSPRMLAAASAGQWHEMPEFLQHVIRSRLEPDAEARSTSLSASPSRFFAARPTPTTTARTSRSATSTLAAPPQADLVRAFNQYQPPYLQQLGQLPRNHGSSPSAAQNGP